MKKLLSSIMWSNRPISFSPNPSSFEGQFWNISLRSCCEMVPVIKRLPLCCSFSAFPLTLPQLPALLRLFPYLRLSQQVAKASNSILQQSHRQLMVDRAVRGGAASQQEAETEASPVLSVSSFSLSVAINNILPFIPESSDLPVTPDP